MKTALVQSAVCVLAGVLLGLAVLSSFADEAVPAANENSAETAILQRGQAIYNQMCAQCHGDKGQGVAGEYDKAFAGDRSVQWLTRRIDKTMPEDKPELCVGEDAAAVARYIHDSFYVPASHGPDKTGSAKPTLQHLTVEQHRQTLADLLASFRKAQPMGEERGLRAEFYSGRDMKDKPLAEQVDAKLDIVFTPEHPLHDRFDKKGHSVRWSGSLLAPQTGEYEIVVRCDQAFRLWLNDGSARGGGIRDEFHDTDSAFIDGWVKSKDKEEFRKRIFLLAGRAYPLMLEFSSHSQGVGDEKRHQQDSAQTSYVRLHWVMPGRVEQPIDTQYLAPVRAAEVFTASAPFPPDDASMGYERGVGVSADWLSAVNAAAIEAANHVIDHFEELAGADIDSAEAREAGLSFCHRFIERAWRRPLSDAEKAQYVDQPFAQADNAELAVKRVILATLISPRFLYPKLGSTEDDGYAVASRLALAVWGGLPDELLLQAAVKGELTTQEQVQAQAQRMSRDERARAKLTGFFHRWLELERAEHVSKDAERFPEFDPLMFDNLRTSLDLFIHEAVFSERSDYRELLSADYLYLNDRLARVYGIARQDANDTNFVKVQVTDQQRSGVITHPFLLTAFAYHDSTSPIHRGVFLTRNIVGRALNPPAQGHRI